MIVEVNGVKYEPRPQETKAKSSRALSMLTAMAAMMGSFEGYNGYGSNRGKPAPEPKIDIVKEYGLIQLKQSKLSRSQRNWVEWKFEKTYKKVDI